MIFLFLSIFLSILFVSHWAVYCFFIRAFNIKKRKAKIILRLSLLILSLSFIGSSLLVHWRENITTKFLYISSGVWLGLLINLLLVIAVFWIIVFIFRILKIRVNMVLISRIAIVAAIFYTCFGIFNVFSLKIKNISVEIENLPAQWQGKTIVHLSDLHLGKALGENFLRKIIKKANNLNPEAVMITGDLFDGINGNLSRFIKPLNNIKAVQGAYYVTGNHEIYLGVEEALNTLKQTKINILDDEVIIVNGLQIIGISYPDFNKSKNVKKIIQDDKNFNSGKPSILLSHSPTNIFSSQNNDNQHRDIYWPDNIDFSAAKELGIDLQLSGHTHKGQIFPFNFITKFIYNGYDYGLHQEGGFAIYTTSGAGVWGPTMRTGSRSEIVAITLNAK